jgi:hypothetical protein
MNVRLELPHTVYLLPKTGVERPDIIVDRAELDPVANKVTLEVENRGDNFGRVLETQLVYNKKKQEAPGFPVFPHSKRMLEIPLTEKAEGENVPTEVSMQFQKFKIEQKLQRARDVAPVTAAAATPLAASSSANAPVPQKDRVP